jgi:predicted ATP-grasp superfamily ATP-dependent carboligase
LGLPGEIYRNGDVIVLQLRSLVKFGRKNDFAKEVASFVSKNKIGDVILLGSLPYSIKPDREITSL